MIGQRNLSEQQEKFLMFLRNVGCISDMQARHILKEYLNVRNTSVKGTLQALSLFGLIRYSKDGKFILNGGFAQKEKVDRNMIEDIAVMNHVYDKCKADHGVEEVQELFAYAYQPSSPIELEFIANSVVYHVVHIPSNQLFKMKMIEDRIRDMSKSLNSAYDGTGNSNNMTLFVFSAGINKDRILTQIVDTTSIEIQHNLIFMSQEELEGEISFEIYAE